MASKTIIPTQLFITVDGERNAFYEEKHSTRKPNLSNFYHGPRSTKGTSRRLSSEPNYPQENTKNK